MHQTTLPSFVYLLILLCLHLCMCKNNRVYTDLAHWGARAPPYSLHSLACCGAVGKEPPTLLACLIACQEHIALLTHPSPHRLA